MVSWTNLSGTVLFIALALANDVCTNDPDFEDEDGYSCDEWKGYDCDEAVTRWGLSEEGKQDLIDSCCETCNAPPVTYPPANECFDTPDFEDAQGYSCGDWKGYDCGGVWKNYSADDLQDVRDNCCNTCTSQCIDNWLFVDEKDYRCGDWKGYDCRLAVVKWEYTKEGEDKIQKECCATCFAHIEAESCEDNEDFVDQDGYKCEDWETYSCITAQEKWGYSEENEKAVIENCCRTCTANCVDSYWFTDAKGYNCKEWEGYDCNLAVSRWGYTQDQKSDILDNCCKTCSTSELNEEDSDDSESGGDDSDGDGEGESDDSGEDDDGPLTYPEFMVLCENTTDEDACKNYGCRHKKAKGKSTCKGAGSEKKKVKCKKVKDESICNRLGCTLKGGKCKGKPTNF